MSESMFPPPPPGGPGISGWPGSPGSPGIQPGRCTGRIVAAAVGGILVGMVLGVAGLWLIAEFLLGQVVRVGPDGDVAAFDLQEGECGVTEKVRGGGDTVRAVSCQESHDLEVYLVATLEVETPQGTLSIKDAAQDLCEPAFGTFVGAAYTRSIYEYVAYVPDAPRWASGERGVACAVTLDTDTQPVGSVAGSRR